MAEASEPFDWQVARAARCLADGGVVAHATEAVFFGLAARASERQACERIAVLKRRPSGKAFIVIAAEVAQLRGLVDLETPLETDIRMSWPGPNTWVLPAAVTCPPWLGDAGGRLAVRVTAHVQAAALCRRTGPLISTSANPSGRRPARALGQVRRFFGSAVDFYLPGKLGMAARPTTVRDGISGAVIRA